MADRNSPLLPVSETLARLLAEVPAPPAAEEVPLAEAAGRVLATAQYAAIDVPGAANSSMDGYTGHFASGKIRAGEPIEISARIPAGQVGPPMKEGTLARIFTGAPLPEGADAVIMQEETRQEGDRVILERIPEPGENVRPRGQDIASGSLLLNAGVRLMPQDVGMLASVGIGRVPVYRRLRIALLCTGDELAEPGEALKPGQIYNSNRVMLQGLIAGLGMTSVNIGTVADSREATQSALLDAAAQADCIVSTGGVSVGEEDYVKDVVEALGELKIWRIAIKPGKPLAFGRVEGTPFFGLPGNPVSVFVTLLVLARPFLLRYQGIERTSPPVYRFPAGFSMKGGVREEYLRVRVESGADGAVRVVPFANQDSAVLSSVNWASGLAVVPIGAQLREGDPVSVHLLHDLFQ